MNTTDVEEAEYRAFASQLGIEPVAVATARRTDSGTRLVRIDAREVERLRAWESFRDEADLLERRLWGEPVESSGRKSAAAASGHEVTEAANSLFSGEGGI